jgi:hypothetical protein
MVEGETSVGQELAMTLSMPPLPKEHGAWAVLYVPMLVGAAIAGELTWNVLLLALSALGVFLSYVPIHAILRHLFVAPLPQERLREALVWSGVYLGFGVVFVVPLLLQGYTLLLIAIPGAVALVGNFLLTRTVGKTILGDAVAVLGLSLSAVCSWYVVTGQITSEALVVWLLNLLFFLCSVFYVHMKIRASSVKQDIGPADRLSLGALNIAYHIVVIAVVTALAFYRFTKLYVLVAFLPMVVHALYGTFRLSRRVKFQRLGLLLLGQSILFGLLLWQMWQ